MNKSFITIVLILLLPVFGMAQGDTVENWVIEKLAGGFSFTEGPVWRSDKLFFSDLGDNKVYTWSENEGLELFLDPSGNTNGIAVDQEGRLILAQQEFRRMSRMETDSSIVPLATHYEGKRLNIPNDVTTHSDGSIFFTDPPIGINEAERELDFSGIFRINSKGDLYLLDKSVQRPNGITFSKDEATLFVSDSRDKQVYAWDVSDTLISGKRLFTTIGGNGYIDGMCTDEKGRLYVAGPIGIFVFEKDGSRADTIHIGKQCANCNWGPVIGSDLFVTSGSDLYRVRELQKATGFVDYSLSLKGGMEIAIFPNPLQSGAQISFHLSRNSAVNLKIYSNTGSTLTTLYDQHAEKGDYSFYWNAEGSAPGIYHVVLETNGDILSKKCVILK